MLVITELITGGEKTIHETGYDHRIVEAIKYRAGYDHNHHR